MAGLARYPEIQEYLDDTEEYENSASEFKQGEDRFLVVTQKGADGQQLIFKWNGQHFEYWDSDTIIDTWSAVPTFPVPGQPPVTLDAQCGPSSDADHRIVHDYVVSQVNRFDSSSGPDGGNLACVWTVRHLVKAAINRWITRTDGTSVFGQELQSCFHRAYDVGDIVPGGIIISPTQNVPGTTRRNVGHVGFLGTGQGNARLVYSNSSAHARLEQNYTVGRWINRYRDTKGLRVLFYPLLVRSIPLTG